MLQLHTNTIHWPSGQLGVLTDDLGVNATKEHFYKFAARSGALFTGREDEFLQATSDLNDLHQGNMDT